MLSRVSHSFSAPVIKSTSSSWVLQLISCSLLRAKCELMWQKGNHVEVLFCWLTFWLRLEDVFLPFRLPRGLQDISQVIPGISYSCWCMIGNSWKFPPRSLLMQLCCEVTVTNSSPVLKPCHNASGSEGKKKKKTSFLLRIRDKVSGQNWVSAAECPELCHIRSLCHTTHSTCKPNCVYYCLPPHNGNGRQQTSAGQLCNILLLLQ